MHIRARMHVVISPIRVFVARGMKTRARAAEAHAMGTRSSIGSVSLLYALSVFFHCVAVYPYTRRSYSSFPLSLSSLLRLVCSSLSPCMRVFASLAARRQRSAATARTTSFILSSLPAMPRVTREPVAVAVCSPRWSDGEGYRIEGGGWGREGKRKRRNGKRRERERRKERGESGILRSSAGLDGREYGYYRWDAF